MACAAANGHEHIVSYLINNGASTTGGYYKSDLKASIFCYVTKEFYFVLWLDHTPHISITEWSLWSCEGIATV